MAARDNHPDYRDCPDDNCPRFPCRVYREGYGDGYAAGYGAGEAAGYAQGYGDGHSDGFSEGASTVPAGR